MPASTRALLGHSLLLLLLAGCAMAAKSKLPGTDRLVDAMRRKDMAAFAEALSERDLDINTPSSSRALPLLEAVRTRDARFVLALLEQGALANAREPASQSTPLHLAFQYNLDQVARLLLAHGADPAARDKTGASPRSMPLSRELAELLAAYDAQGPMAFEAAPGSWLKQAREGGETYYWNPTTGEARWSAPPSCAWLRLAVQGHPVKYVNTLTGQETTAVPPALSWAKLRTADGAELYLNWAANVSAAVLPAELPDDLAAEVDSRVNVRWHNPTTGEYSYVDPAYHTAWRELADEGSGATYYFNVETGEVVWEAPSELGWEQVDEAGSPYYYNKHTGEVSWTPPTAGPLSFLRHDSDL